MCYDLILVFCTDKCSRQIHLCLCLSINGVALTRQNVTRAYRLWLCLSPSFCFSHHSPTSPVELFLSYRPLLLRANFPYHVSSFDIMEAYLYAQTPQAIFCIHVTMFALLHLFHIAPPLCPHFLDFSSIDPSACRMGLIQKHRCLSFNRTP